MVKPAHDLVGQVRSGIKVEAAAMAKEALALSTGPLGLADHLIAPGALARGCSKLLTFDLLKP